MDFRNVQSAPDSSMILESSQQYLKSANIALQIGNFLKGLGYDSRAHIDGDYELICPLVARDAGLGEIGRMGLLITHKLGPRARIAVVTTNAPLIANNYTPDPTVVEFCTFCKKCADCCPGRSIPTGDMAEIDGVKRWKINSDSCYQYWCTAGTDCGRCISVCPFSHPNNVLHNTIRHLIRRSKLVARLAYIADDFLYDRKPKPKPLPKWMKVNR
jgi:ferredoxin